MNIYEAIEMRRSVREFREDPVSDDSLKRILEAARLAPSAQNAQEYRFVVVKNASTRKALSKAAMGQKFVAGAPVIIAAVSLNPESVMECEVPQYPVDVAIAIDHMTLAAVEEGLGTCWIGAFNQDEVKKILKIPAKYKVVALLPLGVPYDEPGPKSRRTLREIVCQEQFEE
jgi:nitroreductase